MKIAITGAHNTGKTTLAEQLRDLLPGYTLKQEPYYELEERGHLFAETPDVDDFLLQLRHALKESDTAESHIIFDRCPLDCLAYMQALGASGMVRDWYDEVAGAMTAIDLLVYVPVETPDRVGGDANEFPELREAVNEILGEWIYDFEVGLAVVQGSADQRAGQVLAAMLAVRP